MWGMALRHGTHQVAQKSMRTPAGWVLTTFVSPATVSATVRVSFPSSTATV